MLVILGLLLVLVGLPTSSITAQSPVSARTAACRCEPDGRPRKPRFLLPVAGIGILPISIAARDSQLPSVGLPSLVDIRDSSPRNALEGERALAVGALAPDTATALPTLMVVAVGCLLLGVYFLIPKRRRRRIRAAWRTADLRPRGGWRLRSIHRRRVGAVLAASGGLLLVLGSREYAEGAEAQRRARAEWFRMGETVVRIGDGTDAANAASRTTDVGSTAAPISARREIPAAMPASAGGRPAAASGFAVASAVPLPLVAMSGREIRRGTPVARLLIPSIDLDEIVMEGVGPVELNGGPGHFPGSVLPGGAGNSILSAHRDRHFRRVGELVVGARIRTETRDGAVEWVVSERRIVSRETPSLFEESEATLTLTTCWPLRYFGPAPDRLLIVAKRVA